MRLLRHVRMLAQAGRFVRAHIASGIEHLTRPVPEVQSGTPGRREKQLIGSLSCHAPAEVIPEVSWEGDGPLLVALRRDYLCWTVTGWQVVKDLEAASEEVEVPNLQRS